MSTLSEPLTYTGIATLLPALILLPLRRITTQQYFGCVATAAAQWTLGAALDHSLLGTCANAAMTAVAAYAWWNGGGGDDTKRRLKKLRAKLHLTRRTAPAPT